ncbi:uncharacterized protein ACA1_172990 [Acanthamoeba castellanii str. Neff]|jgi:hypothetical protein|uniref:Uncharacterized protein n=1 Tax=Acanthamoeba castellanii (strain ATCC 30010 / Neff) TaxID=1257118 RepID=L8HHJ8_ACACF|nr:uncharacterized protein ACA1_172990 [Acanthamoeba castellanii str. Neff]ELR24672.1 hypothetical protein ACA1_172990 [Acanthamoeba castellanii str. Neff]
MQHLPIALLLAFCALFAVVPIMAQTAACDIRLDAFPGSTSCGGTRYCAFAKANETSCGTLRLGSTVFGSKTNCTAKSYELYTATDCSGSPVNTVSNNECSRVASTAFSVHVSFDSQCSSAASVQSWMSYFLF